MSHLRRTYLPPTTRCARNQANELTHQPIPRLSSCQVGCDIANKIRPHVNERSAPPGSRSDKIIPTYDYSMTPDAPNRRYPLRGGYHPNSSSYVYAPSSPSRRVEPSPERDLEPMQQPRPIANRPHDEDPSARERFDTFLRRQRQDNAIRVQTDEKRPMQPQKFGSGRAHDFSTFKKKAVPPAPAPAQSRQAQAPTRDKHDRGVRRPSRIPFSRHPNASATDRHRQATASPAPLPLVCPPPADPGLSSRTVQVVKTSCSLHLTHPARSSTRHSSLRRRRGWKRQSRPPRELPPTRLGPPNLGALLLPSPSAMPLSMSGRIALRSQYRSSIAFRRPQPCRRACSPAP